MQNLSSLIHRLTIGALLVLLTACAGPRPWFEPLGPGSLDRPTPIRQLVTVEIEGRDHTLQTVLNRGRSELTLVGLTSVGQRVFTMSWDGREATLRSRLTELDRLDPLWMLTDIQLAYWPLAPLRTALPEGFALEEIGTLRVLWQDGELLWMRASESASPWQSEVMVFNASLGYRLRIRPLDMQGDGQ